MKKKTKLLLCIISAVLALGVTLYPLVSNYLGEKNRSLVETRYEKTVQKMDNSEVVAAKEAAIAYNETLLTISAKAFSKEALQQAGESYDGLLDVRGDGIMGYIEIPKIGVNLPIYHGTSEETLDRGVGHLLGSSLPVGGAGTHCVLTGHSGLAGQKMFSDLDQLELLDVFYLKVLDETLAYSVIEINTVLPEDTSELAINPQGDDVTLITCTPYGLNTHRLLVRGTRIGYEMAEQMVEEAHFEETPVKSTWTQEYLRGIGIGCLGIAFLASIVALIRSLPKKACQRKEAKHMEKRRGRHETP